MKKPRKQTEIHKPLARTVVHDATDIIDLDAWADRYVRAVLALEGIAVPEREIAA